MYKDMILLIVISLLFFIKTTITQDCAAESGATANEEFIVAFEFHCINFTWRTFQEYQEALSNGTYIPAHNMLSGVKYYGGNIYFALPRTQNGTPVTLAYINENADMTDPLLIPYPSWEMNILEGSYYLHNVFSMEIDLHGIMWVLDGYFLGWGSGMYPAKLVLLDLNNNGEVIQFYNFPDSICNSNGGVLNDLVLDSFGCGYAYITETSANDSGLIVYSRCTNKAWKIRDNCSMLPDVGYSSFSVNVSSSYYGNYGISGIALTPPMCENDPSRSLFYGPLSGVGLYEINTAKLRNESLATSPDITNYITKIGERAGFTDAMMADANNNLYYSVLTENGVAEWKIGTALSQTQTLTNNNLTLWVTSLCFDNDGYLYALTENVVYFVYFGLSCSDINFRVVKYYTGTSSYQFLNQ